MSVAIPLRAFLDQAHDRHATTPQAVADGLAARAAALPCDDEGAEAVRLAEHVMLGHLADPSGLRRFVQALPQALRGAREGACAEAVGRVSWALAQLEAAGGERGAIMLADALRWRALQNVVLARVASGHVPAAAQALRDAEPAAAAHADNTARQAYAACANNVAQHLRDGPRGDADREVLMIEAATIARRAWQRAGTWQHVERADYQLALCHAALGHGALALDHARACLAACEAEGADAAERFFAHEACAHAARAAGDQPAVAAQRTRMQALLDEIADPQMRAWCAQTLAALP
ncbi:hypothetical protein HLB44_19620 [Aquincola sp. S2]|uniref:Uncharacterized protein n=1 Tax=Pseudaquabacterium terrae TaxID=2732868 RepID=A0ABX2EKS8_9BURK|nr:hypothetical protein [Aquabacterium terrae]NRF69209.1 hypothetical protein [Aquabacterium terrae]